VPWARDHKEIDLCGSRATAAAHRRMHAALSAAAAAGAREREKERKKSEKSRLAWPGLALRRTRQRYVCMYVCSGWTPCVRHACRAGDMIHDSPTHILAHWDSPARPTPQKTSRRHMFCLYATDTQDLGNNNACSKPIPLLMGHPDFGGWDVQTARRRRAGWGLR